MNDDFVDKKGIRWSPKKMLCELHDKVQELKKENRVLRSLYEGVLSRINKLEDDTRAAIEFDEDVLHDDPATLMILEFCEDITKLVGE